jgi:hypothetical protein
MVRTSKLFEPFGANPPRRQFADGDSSMEAERTDVGGRVVPFLKTLSALALGLSVAACVTSEPPYPNVAPIDKTGNFGAR